MTGGAAVPAVAAANGLGALRLLAAGLVVLGHSFVICGGVAPAVLGVPVHVLGVHVFFTISGYLIVRSWQEDPSVVRYAVRRFLRIMPALAAVVLLTVLVVGPVFSSLGVRGYFAVGETWRYLWNVALAPYYALPGVFQDGRPFTAVNGSLWSLPIEVALYAVAPVLGGRAAVVRWGVLPVATVGALVAAYVFTVERPEQVAPVVWWNSVPFGLRFAGDFAVGALVRSWRLERGLHPLAGAAVLLVVAALPEGRAIAAAGLVGVPYAVLAVGLWPWGMPGGVLKGTDVSYGLYLWGCPVQQGIVSGVGAGVGPWVLTGVALSVAGVLAFASWHLVERPALGLKPRGRRLEGGGALAGVLGARRNRAARVRS